MTAVSLRAAALRAGAVAAYTTGRDLAHVREVRAAVGRVTVSGRSGLRAIQALNRDNDLWAVDLDPATYCDREPEPDALFPFYWVATQRDLGLPVVRSAGRHARRGDDDDDDDDSLREAFSEPLDEGVVRTVSLDGSWLQPKNLASLLAVAGSCDEPLAFVLAAPFNPLDPLGAVDGLAALGDASAGRYVELLRTDTAGIAFVAAGGALGTIGLSSTTRHHGLPMGSRAAGGYEQRQRSPLCFVPALNSWQHGAVLGALSLFGVRASPSVRAQPATGATCSGSTRPGQVTDEGAARTTDGRPVQPVPRSADRDRPSCRRLPTPPAWEVGVHGGSRAGGRSRRNASGLTQPGDHTRVPGRVDPRQ